MSDLPPLDDMATRAVWSSEDDPTYRYRLRYDFPPDEKREGNVLFIMMNPSYASEDEYDNTVRRCTGYAWDWGYQSVSVGNLFAFRTPFPDGGEGRDGKVWDPIYEQDDPVGPRNADHLTMLTRRADEIVCAWGNADASNEEERELVMTQARFIFWLHDILNKTVKALKINKTGHPAHPLYLAKDLEPKPYAHFENADTERFVVPLTTVEQPYA